MWCRVEGSDLGVLPLSKLLLLKTAADSGEVADGHLKEKTQPKPKHSNKQHSGFVVSKLLAFSHANIGEVQEAPG